MIEISYRCKDWPWERPDLTETVHEADERTTLDAMKAEGCVITGTRKVGWQESLARMENPEL